MRYVKLICMLLTGAVLLAGAAVLSSCDKGGSGKGTEAPTVITGEDLTGEATEADTSGTEPAPADDTSSAVVWRTVRQPDYTQYLNPAVISRALKDTDAIAVALNGKKAWAGGAYKDGVTDALTREGGELKVSGSVLSGLSGKSVSDGDVYAAARAMGLKTVRAERRRMQSTVSLWGRVELTPDARMSVASSVGGRVQLKVRPLQAVRAGDVLFTVDAPEVRAKTKEIEILERRLKVYRELNRASAELETQLALRKAERETLLAGADETNGVVTVRATEAGRVDALSVLDGAWVSSGAAVVELVRPERLRVLERLRVFETSVRLLT